MLSFINVRIVTGEGIFQKAKYKSKICPYYKLWIVKRLEFHFWCHE